MDNSAFNGAFTYDYVFIPVLGQSIDPFQGGNGKFLFKLSSRNVKSSKFRVVYASEDWEGDWKSFDGLKLSFEVEVAG